MRSGISANHKGIRGWERITRLKRIGWSQLNDSAQYKIEKTRVDLGENTGRLRVNIAAVGTD